MDLGSLSTIKKAEEGSKLYFKSPQDNSILEEFMVVLGQDSTVFKQIERDNLLKKVNSNKKKKDKATENDLLKIEEDQMDLVISMIKSFGTTEDKKEVDYILFNGKKLKFSESNVRLLLTELPWMYNQVIAFMGDRSNFL